MNNNVNSICFIITQPRIRCHPFSSRIPDHGLRSSYRDHWSEMVVVINRSGDPSTSNGDSGDYFIHGITPRVARLVGSL